MPLCWEERLGAESAPGLFFVTEKDLVAAEADYPPPSGKSNRTGCPLLAVRSLAMLLAMRLASSKVSTTKWVGTGKDFGTFSVCRGSH